MIIPPNIYLVTKSHGIPIMIISLVMLSGLVFGMQTQAFATSAALLNNTGVNPTSDTSGSIGGVTVTTDKASYSTGDTITISGTVQNYISGTPIGIKINDPKGDLVKVESVDVKSDRTFFAIITDDAGALWQTSGMYKVTAVYGSIDREAQTTFQFIANGQSGNAIGGGLPNPNGNQTTAYQIISANSHNTLTVKTDLSSYNQGDTIIITGHVNKSDSSTAINLRVTSPSKNLVFIGQLLPSVDGSFAKTLPATGASWTDAGTYTITAQYGLYTYATVQFHYNSGNGQATITPEAGNPYLECPDCNSTQQIQLTSSDTLKVRFSTEPSSPSTTGQTSIQINFINKQNSPQQHVDYKVSIIQAGNQVFGTPVVHTASGSVVIPFQFQTAGNYQVIIEIYGVLFQPIHPETATFSLQVGISHNPYLKCPDCNDTSNIQQVPSTANPVPTPTPEPVQPTTKIPHWVKTVFNLYGQGQVSDDDLISALRFLIQTGVIRIS